MEIQRNAPTLAGSRPCPSCKTPIERDATLCIHCGYNLATGKKAAANGWFAANRNLVVILTAGVLIVIAALAFLIWPAPEAPPPFIPADPPAAEEPAAADKPVPAQEPVEAIAETPDVAAAEPVPEEDPAPESGPTAEELAEQQAEQERLARETERAEFEARKARAEQALRQRLDEREPLAKLGDEVEVRRRNGMFHKGTLQRFAGAGAERVAVIDTATREIGVPLVELDAASRRRLDRDFREAFIARLLNTRVTEPNADAVEPEE